MNHINLYHTGKGDLNPCPTGMPARFKLHG